MFINKKSHKKRFRLHSSIYGDYDYDFDFLPIGS